jgi:F-type H+-transporting ATPase subunit b
MADLSALMLLAAEAAEHGAEHAEPVALGLVSPTAMVALAMLVLIGIAVWAKVPAMLTGMLDSGIADIRKQLDEAKALRAEAEALRKEYADKIANAEKDAGAMKTAAAAEAKHIIERAQSDAEALIARRGKSAEEKIASAERAVVTELRAMAADAAAQAARGLIASGHNAAADKKLVDTAIAGI